MKFHLFLATFFLFCSAEMFSQIKSSIIDDLNASKTAQGTVKVYIDDNIKALVDSPAGTSSAKRIDNDTITGPSKPTIFVKRPGFKIQIFSGNDQRRSKDEAYSKQNLIRNMFPDVDTSVSFHAPFWRLRAGNYLTYEDAAHAMIELKKAFPSFGKEMYVVKDQVSVAAE